MLPFEQALCLQQPSVLDKSHIVLTLLPSIAIPDLEDRLFSLKFYFGYFTYVDLLVSVCGRVHVGCGSLWRRAVSHQLKQVLHTVVSHVTWGVGTRLGPSLL